MDNGPYAPGTFLFRRKLQPQLRPKIGDSITIDQTFQNYRITRDEIPESEQVFFRITEGGDRRITEEDANRITDEGQVTQGDLDKVTHNYFITPANNPQRISSWTTNKFEEDQTLKHLFR